MSDYDRNRTDVADEQLTVPEDREEAAAAEGRSTAAEVEDDSDVERRPDWRSDAERQPDEADDDLDRDRARRDEAEDDLEGDRARHDEADRVPRDDDAESERGWEPSTAAAAEPGPASTPTSTSTQSPPRPDGERQFELFGGSDRDDYQRRWESIQASFVDDPKGAAEQADALVGELVEHVNRRHRELHDDVGSSSERGDTETMRIALRQYRSFFRVLVGG
jgi:hypothetical protein